MPTRRSSSVCIYLEFKLSSSEGKHRLIYLQSTFLKIILNSMKIFCIHFLQMPSKTLKYFSFFLFLPKKFLFRNNSHKEWLSHIVCNCWKTLSKENFRFQDTSEMLRYRKWEISELQNVTLLNAVDCYHISLKVCFPGTMLCFLFHILTILYLIFKINLSSLSYLVLLSLFFSTLACSAN